MYYEDYEDFAPELPEYMEAIQSIVDAEVERRLAKAVEDLDKLREEQKKYNNDRAEWAEIVRNNEKARRDAERKLELAEKEMQATVNEIKAKKLEDLFDGWKKGDRAYIVEYRACRPRCPVCEDKYEIQLPVVGVSTQVRTDCPYCKRGQKVYFPEYRRAEVRSFHVENPLVSMNEKTGKVYPAAYCWNSDFRGIKDLTGCFRSEDEAVAFADQHNEAALAACSEKIMEDVHKKGFDQLLPENRKKEGE